MYSFLFRKTIFCGWDHILGLFLANILYMALAALGMLWFYLYSAGTIGLPAAILLIILTILLASLYSVGIAGYASNICRGAGKGRGLENVMDAVKTHVPHALLHAFITEVIMVNYLFAIPFYMGMPGFFGPMMAFVAVFLSIFLIANFKFYLPLCLLRPEDGVTEVVKYSFAYAMDNKAVTFVMLLRTAAGLLISVPFAGIIPGLAGILVADTCTAQFLNSRYVLAQERDREKNEVPVDDVLDTLDRDRYEKRKFISLLFPGR